MWVPHYKMVETMRLALKDRAPKAFGEMEKDGTLNEFLESRAEAIESEAMTRELGGAGKKNQRTDWRYFDRRTCGRTNAGKSPWKRGYRTYRSRKRRALRSA